MKIDIRQEDMDIIVMRTVLTTDELLNSEHFHDHLMNKIADRIATSVGHFVKVEVMKKIDIDKLGQEVQKRLVNMALHSAAKNIVSDEESKR